MASMNKKPEICRGMAQLTGMSQYACGVAYDALVDTIFDMLAREESVTLNKIGTFRQHDISEKRIVHPLTGLTYVIPPHKQPRFHLNKMLRTALREGRVSRILEDEDV